MSEEKRNEDSITKKLVYGGSTVSKNAAGLYESLSNLEFIINENWTGDYYVSDNMKDEYNKKMVVSWYVREPPTDTYWMPFVRNYVLSYLVIIPK